MKKILKSIIPGSIAASSYTYLQAAGSHTHGFTHVHKEVKTTHLLEY